jgi:hypothetical protein
LRMRLRYFLSVVCRVRVRTPQLSDHGPSDTLASADPAVFVLP